MIFIIILHLLMWPKPYIFSLFLFLAWADLVFFFLSVFFSVQGTHPIFCKSVVKQLELYSVFLDLVFKYSSWLSVICEQDEMLMFMEYCDSGSIEEVAHIGLPEYMIRRYTQEIVRAIAHLHENNIVHRDIKGRIS